jgi:thiol:disulfide interchange protein DsbD
LAIAGHARVDLVADSTPLPASSGATLGVRFTLDPGWHIYWRNPGQSGGAPTVNWKAPAGVTIGDLQWTVPEIFRVAGDTTYGYRHRAMMLAPITRTAAAGDSPIALQAVVEYQICKDVCVKETARPSLMLQAGAAAPGAASAEIADARAHLPTPMPPAWKATLTSTSGELVMTIATGQRESAASFLPYQSDLIDDSAPQRVEPRPDGLVLHIKKAGPQVSGPAQIDGLLIRPGARAVEVPARRQPVAGNR